ncbi:non-canonical purine NTP pyrophosphatase [Candidatus Tokpelaia sp.]|uniref:non-canonical purine NTP pyrophosphatase n=1 Tax=Candidatus Tokpelaia sp. TaxID=2233777 RepID=UPI001FEEED98|nr:non-canonical purine NTP pyrophosphatase [Candidatus Tokpelaia sp.]
MRRLEGKKLVIATHNAGKLREFDDLMAPFGFETMSAGQLGLAIPAETGRRFAENAYIKAFAAAQASGLPALADDSGLEVDALGGAPGVYTADWAEQADGRRDFAKAMQKVEDRLQKALADKAEVPARPGARPAGIKNDMSDERPRAPAENGTETGDIEAGAPRALIKNEAAARSGRFVAVLCLAWPDGHAEYFRGAVEGRLVWPPRGEQGFGFDPIFQPEGYSKTFGEMTALAKHGWKPWDKEALSHRARAFKAFAETMLK